MSRAGKYPVQLKDGVSVTKADKALIVRGPKGELKVSLEHKNANLVNIEIKENEIFVTPTNADDKESRAMWGAMTRLIKSAVMGVTAGFSKEMGMKGVGFKASVSGNKLVLIAGFSHDVKLDIPNGITVESTAPTEFKISGIDKQAVGQFAAEVRAIRPPEPYKGKGIFYKSEKIRRKEGKKK